MNGNYEFLAVIDFSNMSKRFDSLSIRVSRKLEKLGTLVFVLFGTNAGKDRN